VGGGWWMVRGVVGGWWAVGGGWRVGGGGVGVGVVGVAHLDHARVEPLVRGREGFVDLVPDLAGAWLGVGLGGRVRVRVRARVRG
jgi:hypothetical protein